MKINEEIGQKILAFLDRDEWTFNEDQSGIKLQVDGNKLSICLECAMPICWNGKTIHWNDYPEGERYWFFVRGEYGTLKKIREKSRLIYRRLREELRKQAKEDETKLIQKVIKEMEIFPSQPPESPL